MNWEVLYHLYIVLSEMISFVRKVVAGPKRKTEYNGQELDLTYITDRIIAMAYPASDILEKTYRNSITDVAAYFNSQHANNYLIINVSSRPYDKEFFNNQVSEFQWPDHQAPPLTTLIAINHQIKHFIETHPQGVVAVHCNHGKGRTGTAIISFMLYVGFMQSANQCLSFYNKKRFNNDSYGVDQPCQTRYLGYIEKILKSKNFPNKLIAYKLERITQKGLGEEYQVSLHRTRDGSVKLTNLQMNSQMTIQNNALLMSDVFIQIYLNTWKGLKKVARMNVNLYFLDKSLVLIFEGKDIKLSGSHHSQFEVKFHFQYYCLCHMPTYEGTKCLCSNQRKVEEKYWNEMVKQIKERQAIKEESIDQYLFFKDKKSLKNSKEEDLLQQLEKLDQEVKQQPPKFRNSHQEKLYDLVTNGKNRHQFQSSSDDDQIEHHQQIIRSKSSEKDKK